MLLVMAAKTRCVSVSVVLRSEKEQPLHSCTSEVEANVSQGAISYSKTKPDSQSPAVERSC